MKAEIEKIRQEYIEKYGYKKFNPMNQSQYTNFLEEKILSLSPSAEKEEEKWISVEDELPDQNEEVIVIQNPKTTGTKKPLFARFEDILGKPVFHSYSETGTKRIGGSWVDITHWQPLPAPPKN